MALMAGTAHAATSTDSIATTPKAKNERPLRFAWGAALGGGVELSGHDMSTLGISAQFGLEWKWVRFFGIGAEADIMVANSSRMFPLTAIFQTDFSKRRRLVFADLRGGICLNYFTGFSQENVPYASGGVGITLASGRTFSSHLILAYTYNGRSSCYIGDTLRDCPGMSYATMRLGVMF